MKSPHDSPGSPPSGKRPSAGPCAQIQADLSAMLDGELDPASVRRVMVHSDACPSCSAFLRGIRMQARSHRHLHTALTGADDDSVAVPVAAEGSGGVRRIARVRVRELRRQLTSNRQQLARIFYELGRGFVLMGISPNFSRVVSREPVPIPDMFQRGKILIDEVERLAGVEADAVDSDLVGAEWVRAKEVFGEGWARTPEANLRSGIGLLRETVALDPESQEARIYLGHAYHVAGDHEAAEKQFCAVLDHSEDLGSRGFALFNLGNLHLESGDLDAAESRFLELVESGAVHARPQFGLIYFNLALAYGMQQRFDECRIWLERLHDELPHKRRMIADEFRNRSDFVASLSRHPDVYADLSNRFPAWFPKKEAC